MFGKKKKPIAPEITDEMKKVFSKVELSTVRFSKDRLPFLQNLLQSYREATEEERRHRQHDIELRLLLKSVALELVNALSPQGYRANDEEKILTFLAGYAGHLLRDLQELKERGWDGKGLQHDSYADNYRSDAVRQLEMLVRGLEAGGEQVTLEIPAEMAGKYDVWFISSIEYAIHKGRGPAADKE